MRGGASRLGTPTGGSKLVNVAAVNAAHRAERVMALAATCRWIVQKSHPKITPASGTASTRMPTKSTSSSMAAWRSGTDAMSRLVQPRNQNSKPAQPASTTTTG